jgi:hypothetical protein
MPGSNVSYNELIVDRYAVKHVFSFEALKWSTAKKAFQENRKIEALCKENHVPPPTIIKTNEEKREVLKSLVAELNKRDFEG